MIPGRAVLAGAVLAVSALTADVFASKHARASERPSAYFTGQEKAKRKAKAKAARAAKRRNRGR